MPFNSPDLARAYPNQIPPNVRFADAVLLQSGEAIAVSASHMRAFDELARFGPAGEGILSSNPAKWLAARLIEIASSVQQLQVLPRPILTPAPMAALAHSNTAIACDAAVRQTTLCPQEFCLMFEDAAFSADPIEARRRIDRLRKCGFRVGIDMRKARHTKLGSELRMAIDTICIDARHLGTGGTLEAICETATAAGIAIIADRPRWRDGDMLAKLGILAGFRPITDA